VIPLTSFAEEIAKEMFHWTRDEPQHIAGRCGQEKNLAMPGIEPGPSTP
jgi:hypothetical protein